jgi:hypothetical protein
MKKILLTSAVLMLVAFTRLSAQTTINTWYVIPPTSGCNGVWAVDASQLATSCGTPPYQYILNPMGCADLMNWTTVADTVYWPLCAFPCDLTTIDANGVMCICGTGTTTDAPEQSADRITTTYPNPATTAGGWNILLHQPGDNVTVNIYNPLGEVVVTQQTSAAGQIVHVDLSALAAGTYTAMVTVNEAVAYNQQLIITQ